MNNSKSKSVDRIEVILGDYLALKTDYEIVHIIGGKKWPDKFVKDWLKKRYPKGVVVQ